MPTATVSDQLNRSQTMTARIKSVVPGRRFCGQARTVQTMVGDGAIIHVAASYADAGQVLVIDAGGVEDTAVWGGILAMEAIKRGIAAVVIDGAVRDLEDISNLGLPVFARAVVPRGPHKGFGGTMDGLIAAGGVAVRPGDLVLGDEDGVAVVPLELVDSTLAATKAHLEREKQWIAAMNRGELTVKILGIPDPEMIP